MPPRRHRTVIMLGQTRADFQPRRPPEGAVRVLLCADGLGETISATSWLERMSPTEPSLLCIASIAWTGPLALRSAGAFEGIRVGIVDRSRGRGELARARLGGRWPDATMRVVEGDPHEQLLRAAAEWRADLVVVGLAGDGGRPSIPGSIALITAHHAECSVLVAAAAPPVVRSVVLGMDGSASAREAVRLLSMAGLDPPPGVFAVSVADASWHRTIDLNELPVTDFN